MQDMRDLICGETLSREQHFVSIRELLAMEKRARESHACSVEELLANERDARDKHVRGVKNELCTLEKEWMEERLREYQRSMQEQMAHLGNSIGACENQQSCLHSAVQAMSGRKLVDSEQMNSFEDCLRKLEQRVERELKKEQG